VLKTDAEIAAKSCGVVPLKIGFVEQARVKMRVKQVSR
tara:strand:- start:14503 stop:14616 length:114 start_codon:yes stop_codon:yes gene_type:complete